MKSLPCFGRQFVWSSLLAASLGASIGLAQTPDDPPIPKGPPALVRSVKMISDAEGPALEIVSSQAPEPAIEFLDSPPRLVIDLPNTRVLLPGKRLEVGSEQVRAVRMNQYQQAPPVTRVVVDLVHPMGYSSDGNGQRLLIHIHPMAEARQNIETPSVPAFTKGVQPAFVPVVPGSSGAVVEVGSRLSADSAVKAGLETTILRLARGGEVRVCPKTTLSVTPSQNGRDLMLGMSTGALEAQYTLNASTDSVVTPDFRMLLAGSGELHFAISADARGNTCVRALPGNTASVVVSELLGDGSYQVKPDEQVFFRAGKLNQMETTVPDDCGCPPPQIPALRAALPPSTVSEKDLPPAVHLAQPEDQAKPVTAAKSNSGMPSQDASSSQVTLTVTPPGTEGLPAPSPNAPHAQVDAPFVFRASDLPPATTPDLGAGTLPMSRAANPVPTLIIAEPPEHKGVLGKVKGFFASIFR
ncbi:MAG: AMIN domain-containing protein [Terriglobales bacterium]